MAEPAQVPKTVGHRQNATKNLDIFDGKPWKIGDFSMIFHGTSTFFVVFRAQTDDSDQQGLGLGRSRGLPALLAARPARGGHLAR